MLVLAPAACIMSGIALSEAFDVFTRSIKFQLPGLPGFSEVDVSIFLSIVLHLSSLFIDYWGINFVFLTAKAGDTSSESTVPQTEVPKTDKSGETLKERPSRKNRKKEKEPVEKPSIKSQIEKRLLVLPFEGSVLAIFLLVLLGAFYVVYKFSSFPIFYVFLHISVLILIHMSSVCTCMLWCLNLYILWTLINLKGKYILLINFNNVNGWIIKLIEALWKIDMRLLLLKTYLKQEAMQSISKRGYHVHIQKRLCPSISSNFILLDKKMATEVELSLFCRFIVSGQQLKLIQPHLLF